MMFTSQVEHFKGNLILPVLGIIGVAIIFLFPKITKKIPSPIISILVVSGFYMLVSVVLFNNVVVQIPIAALAAVMDVVSFKQSTGNQSSA